MAPAQVGAGQRGLGLDDGVGRSGSDDLAPESAGAGSEIDHPVGIADGLLVVLDHDHGVAEIPHPLEGVEQSPVVALVEPDGRFVEDVEHPHELRPDLGGQADALALSPGQAPRHAVEGQIVEPDRHQETEAVAHLAKDLGGDLGIALVEGETVEPLHGIADRQRRDLGQTGPGHLDREAFGPQPGAVAGVTGRERHESLEFPPDLLGRGLFVTPFKTRDDALEAVTKTIGALAPLPDKVVFLVRSEHDQFANRLRQLPPLGVEVEAEMGPELFELSSDP